MQPSPRIFPQGAQAPRRFSRITSSRRISFARCCCARSRLRITSIRFSREGLGGSLRSGFDRGFALRSGMADCAGVDSLRSCRAPLRLSISASWLFLLSSLQTRRSACCLAAPCWPATKAPMGGIWLELEQTEVYRWESRQIPAYDTVPAWITPREVGFDLAGRWQTNFPRR